MAKLLTVVAVIGGLYWAQPVLIPIALAVFFSSLLDPVVRTLQRRHLGRTPSVVLVVLLATMLLGIAAWRVQVELVNLTQELPAYTENVRAKVKSLRQLGQGASIERLAKMTQDITWEWERALPSPAEQSADTARENLPPETEESSPDGVEPERDTSSGAAQPEGPSWLSWSSTYFGSAIATLAGLALTLALVVFMLLEHEALRNRVIRLMGSNRMTATTKALDDAGGRISRYLFMQLAGNSTYGLAWGLSLYFIGVDYALLWGFLAAILRYIPYIGAPVAALLPITLSLAQFPGWWLPIGVIAIFLLLELIWNNIVETLLYGHNIGVSPVAMLVSAAFWTFMWGPIGLLLSGPLTVCLAVLGNHVPELGFFAVLLGDTPALDPQASYYQRLLARDQDEATQLIWTQEKASPAESLFDQMLLPALVYTKRDRESGDLSTADEEFIHQVTREIVEELGERHSAATLPAGANAVQLTADRSAAARFLILACPARDLGDRLALEMLQQLLDPAQWKVELTAVETLTAETVELVVSDKPAVICIGALPPGGLAHARYLCKRLRARHPNLKILVGRWGLKDNPEANREQLQQAGADLMATTLLETRKQLYDWLPVLAYEKAKIATTEPQLMSAFAPS